ncbi:hypothetical protein [Metapseudomonas otitidis]|uniref:hypothetical protein n=1 Tax=Metapseudomonas otitidis TaxID=319939 RepID=UPI001F21178C|nr:hypothetical protein [Pseudomonas otitidis]
MNQELLVVGIDISKNFLDVFVSGSATLQRYANDASGRAQLATDMLARQGETGDISKAR